MNYGHRANFGRFTINSRQSFANNKWSSTNWHKLSTQVCIKFDSGHFFFFIILSWLNLLQILADLAQIGTDHQCRSILNYISHKLFLILSYYILINNHLKWPLSVFTMKLCLLITALNAITTILQWYYNCPKSNHNDITTILQRYYNSPKRNHDDITTILQWYYNDVTIALTAITTILQRYYNSPKSNHNDITMILQRYYNSPKSIHNDITMILQQP